MKFDRRFSQVEEWRAKNMTVGELLQLIDVFLLALAWHTTAEQYEKVRQVAEREVIKVCPEMAEACRDRWPYPATSPSMQRRPDEH